MLLTVAVWVLGFLLAVLVGFHLHLRRTLRNLAETVRQSGWDATGPVNPSGPFTPVYVQDLAKAVERTVEAYSDRISLETERQRRNASILDQFDEGLVIVSEDLRVVSANEAARRDFAQGRQIVGKTVIEAFFDHRHVNLMERALQHRAKQSETLRLDETIEIRGEIMERYVSMETGPLPAVRSGEAGLWVILRDESERYHIDQIRKDFVANASHEIRTPLSIICGYLENLADGDVTDPETVQRFYGIMRKHANRLTRLVEDMLTITKLERSPEALKLDVFDLAESLFDMVEHLQPVILEQKARVTVDFPEADRSIRGDRFYWDQIFFNLVENALKQNQRPGLEVVVGLRSSPEGHEITVTDNGIGIPASHMPHVFKRFYRVERHHSQNQVKGTGLGLSIVKRAVEAHGGQVGVESKPGMATTFRIVVPRSPGE